MNRAPHWACALLLSASSACQNAAQDRPSPQHAASPPPPSVPASPPLPDAGAAADAAAPAAPPAVAQLQMPPLVSVDGLRLRHRQGGPFHPKCGGVISELTIDFKKQRWTRGFCRDESKGASKNPKQPLEERSGALTPEHRALIDREYAKLVHERGPSCGADVGRIELTLQHQSGSATVFVNRGTSCADNPPAVAHDLGEFQSRIFAITR